MRFQNSIIKSGWTTSTNSYYTRWRRIAAYYSDWQVFQLSFKFVFIKMKSERTSKKKLMRELCQDVGEE